MSFGKKQLKDSNKKSQPQPQQLCIIPPIIATVAAANSPTGNSHRILISSQAKL